MTTAEEAIRILQVEPARFRYLEFLCQDFLSLPAHGFTRQYSSHHMKVLKLAHQLLESGIPAYALKTHLARNLSFKQEQEISDNESDPFAKPAGACVAVASGKGGVGKSMLSLNLAIELSRAGSKVAVVDADLGTANLHVMTGLRVEKTLKHVISGECTIEDVVTSLPGGPDLVAGASGIFELANLGRRKREALMMELVRLRKLYDYLIVDAAAGVAASVIDFVAFSDLGVVVASPEKTAITDAYAVLKLSCERNRQCRLALVANRVRSAREGAFVLGRISSCARRFLHQSVLEMGYIWEDSHARRAVNEGQPLVVQYPRSRASTAIRKIAALLREQNLVCPREEKTDKSLQVVVNNQPVASAAGSVPG